MLSLGPGLSALDFFDDRPDDELASAIVQEMSDNELIGQLLLLGYFGYPSPEILEWTERYAIGGIKVFGWNAGNLPRLGQTISRLQDAASEGRFSIPLFVATDQEGGWVRHVKGDTSVTPGNLAIGASGLGIDAYKTGYYIGRELRVLGINMNFAPTVDIYTNPNADVIGPRAFSSDPIETAQLAVSYYKGMEAAGIICTAKHFPGHGAASEDSHGTLPLINADLETIWDRELVPYRFLAKAGLPAVMSGHIAYPKISGAATPASLCPQILHGVLRDRVGFNGLIVTDDMQMNGADISGGIAEACRRAIIAGNNVLMISRNTRTYHQVRRLLLASLEKEPGFRDLVEDSVRRILLTKLRYLKGEKAVPLNPRIEAIREGIPDPEGSAFFLSQAHRSVTLIRDKEIPLDLEAAGKTLIAGQLRQFHSVAKEFFPDADIYDFPYSPFFQADEGVTEELKEKVASYDTVIFCLANPNSAAVLAELKDIKPRLYVISVLTPVYLRQLPWVPNALAVYGTGEDSIEAGFSALTGAFSPQGLLPLDFETP